MRPFGNGAPDALTAARVLVATALVLLTTGAASMLLLYLRLVTAPVDTETTYAHMEAVLPALACVAVSSCIGTWGLAWAAAGRLWWERAESRPDPPS